MELRLAVWYIIEEYTGYRSSETASTNYHTRNGYVGEVYGKFSILTNVSYLKITDENYEKKMSLEMWANAQRDGRPAEHRWRPLFNAVKFG